jgi:hypothetical protein
MPLTAGTPTRVTNNFNVFEVLFPITTAGNYATHGVTLSLAGLGVPSNSIPDTVQIFEQPATGTSASGVSYIFANGTTQANGAVQLFQGNTEVTNATSFASLSIQNLVGFARFLKFQ